VVMVMNRDRIVGRVIDKVQRKFCRDIADILKAFEKDKSLSYNKQAEILGCGVKAQHILNWRKRLGMPSRITVRTKEDMKSVIKRLGLRGDNNG